MSVEKELEKYAPKFDMAAGYADSVAIIKENFQSMVENVVSNGFYLKHIRDNKLFMDGGYNTFAEFAKEEFGLSESSASRYISINKRFSIDGNSPFLMEDKKAFSKGQLWEMLRLTDEQLEQVTPDMTVKEIRALATSQEIEIDIEEPEEQIPGQLDIDFYPEVLPEGYKTQEETETVEAVEVEKEEIPVEFAKAEVVIDGEYREIGIYEENSEVETEFLQTEEVEKIHDETWFVEQYISYMPKEAAKLYEVCMKEQNNSDRAKAVQKRIAPYGCHTRSCSEYSFDFHGFAGGMDFKIGEEKMHLKYGRFVKELMKLYEANATYRQQETEERQPDEEIQENTQLEEKELPLESKEVTPHSVLETAKIRLHNMLQTEKQYGQTEASQRLVESQKIIVAALAAMVTELDGIAEESDGMVMPVQPELPIMKNNEQRAAFIDAYSEWTIWIETKATGEKYYRYDFENGTSFVVRTYFHKCFDYKSHAIKWEERYTDDEGAQEYYILEEGKYFKDCLTNRSNMIEFLKRLQK